MSLDDVDQLVRAGRYAEAAARARATGDPRRACELYELIWEFREAAACALEARDQVAALRNLLDAQARDEACALAREMARQGRSDAALAASVLESRRLFDEAARIREDLGETERAVALYRRADLPFDAARLLEATGHDADAGRLLEAVVAGPAVRLGPDEIGRAHLMLGRILGRRREHELAARHLQEARRDPTLRAEADRALVAELLALGLRDAARAALRRGCASDPSLPADLEAFAETKRPDEPPGAPLLAGRYRIGKLLGAGGSGRVHKARDEVSGCDVAIKIFYAAPAERRGPEAEAVQRFLREARTLSMLRHEHIVSVLDIHEPLGIFVLELMEATLADRLTPRLAPQAVRRMALEVLSGLEAAHARGVIHRDIKPANIFFDRRGVAKLGDFGVAHLLDLGQTQTGELFGTLATMAPEQITGAPLSFAADFYGLGVTLFCALTGRLPFVGPDFVAEHLGEVPPVPSTLLPQIDPAWDPLLLRLLAKDPSSRPASIDELRRDLLAIGSGPLAVVALRREPAPAPAPAVEPEPARAPTLHEAPRYVREASLGKTANATLSRAVDTVLRRSVILECFLPPGPDHATRNRLLGFARALGPHLQRVLAWDRAARTVVYDAPAGETLSARLRQGPLILKAGLQLLADLAAALTPLHGLGVAHGAIDADRVLIDDLEVVTLTVAGLGPDAAATPADDLAACLRLCAAAVSPEVLPGAEGQPARASDLAQAARAAARDLARRTRALAHILELGHLAAGSSAALELVRDRARAYGISDVGRGE